MAKARNSKPRVAVVNGKLEPRNNAARRAQLTQQYAQAGQVASRQSIANQARRKSAGGTGG